MLCLMDGFFLKPKLCSCSALVFKHLVMLLLLIDSNKGQSLGVGPSQTVVALVGDDVTLPCQLEPTVNAVSKSVEWGRPDLKPKFVHVWYEGQNLLDNQNPSYKGRTSVSMVKLRRGDLSLSLSAVKHSDNGAYRCYFPSQEKHSTVELVVGSFSSPLITHVSKSDSGVVLQCESEGWYPKPEVLWLDSEGKVFSDGPTETLRGPDGLFTVSSRVTVEKRKSNIFTCRVHQRNINRTRETHIQISADVFETSSPVVYISIIVVLVLGFVCAAAFVFWKWRQIQTKEAKLHQAEAEEREQLMAKKEDLEQRERRLEDSQNDLEKKRKTLEEDLKKDLEKKNKRLEEDLKKDLEKKRKTLEDSQNDLEKKRKTLEDSQNDLEKKRKTLEEDLKDLEKKRKTLEDSQKDLKEKKKTLEDSQNDLEEKKKRLEEDLKKDLEEKKNRLEEDLKKKDEEDKDLGNMIHNLTKQSQEVKKQRDELRNQEKGMKRNIKDINDEFQSAEEKADGDRAQGYADMKRVAVTAKCYLENRKHEEEKLHNKTDIIQITTDGVLNVMKERKRAVESNERDICEQLEEIKRKLSEHNLQNMTVETINRTHVTSRFLNSAVSYK